MLAHAKQATRDKTDRDRERERRHRQREREREREKERERERDRATPSPLAIPPAAAAGNGADASPARRRAQNLPALPPVVQTQANTSSATIPPHSRRASAMNNVTPNVTNANNSAANTSTHPYAQGGYHVRESTQLQQQQQQMQQQMQMYYTQPGVGLPPAAVAGGIGQDDHGYHKEKRGFLAALCCR